MTTHQAQAEELLAAMKLLRDDRDSYNYKSAMALLAVHSAIAFNDAVLMTLDVGLSTSRNHHHAHTKTQKACAVRGIGQDGLDHLELLLANKSNYSYYGAVDIDAARAAAADAESFAAWAYDKVLKREPGNA